MNWRRVANDMARGKDPDRAVRDEQDRRRLDDGPTRPYERGDVLEIWHKQARVALVRVDGRVRDHSLMVSARRLDVMADLPREVPETLVGKITFVSPREQRLYLNLAPDREKVWRGITIKRIAR